MFLEFKKRKLEITPVGLFLTTHQFFTHHFGVSVFLGRSKKKKNKPKMTGLFSGLQFSFEFGTTAKWTEKQSLKTLVETHGGSVSWMVNKKVTPSPSSSSFIHLPSPFTFLHPSPSSPFIDQEFENCGVLVKG